MKKLIVYVYDGTTGAALKDVEVTLKCVDQTVKVKTDSTGKADLNAMTFLAEAHYLVVTKPGHTGFIVRAVVRKVGDDYVVFPKKAYLFKR